MKKVFLSLFLVLALVADCFAAGAEKPEVAEVRWARANSGNVLVTLAKENGYLKEVGIDIIEMPLNSTHDALTALSTKQVDVTSNNGTNNPLQFMASGSDFTIVGGYMLKGMYIVARKGTGWKGIGDLVGKKMATSKSQTWVTGPLLNAGYSLDDVIWLTYSTNSDRLAAVIAGEADYACLSGDLLFRVGNMKDDIEIVAWADDLMPNYGCCRMNMHTDFVKANPVTVKLILKCLIRAEQFLRAHPDESVKILAKELNASEDFVAAYLKNPNYTPSVDPVKHAIKATWDIMMRTGFLAPEAKDYDLDAHINIDLYKAALDELIAERRDEDPAFYDGRLEFFKANNL
ncbi:MAG: ABC transporter substrate-binding protein [Synergistaceae bacterium]|nr:ABC transporter substrate-binding protein [Synergistaceae bacterium]